MISFTRRIDKTLGRDRKWRRLLRRGFPTKYERLLLVDNRYFLKYDY